MNIPLMIHNLLSGVMHLKRVKALGIAIEAAYESRQLSVTGLGRALSLPIQERSGIRKMDRLVGNEKLHASCETVYQLVARQLIGEQQRPWLLIDWSPIPNTTDNILRAALVCPGRALSLYEEVHPEAKLGNRQVQSRFLDTLKRVLPEGCCPVLITDAGFHAGWFKAVQKQGWDYVGRVRGLVKFCRDDETHWASLSSLYAKATSRAAYYGTVTLSKSEPVQGQLYFVKGKPKGRICKNQRGQRRYDTGNQNHAKSAKEPWVLLTSFQGKRRAKRVVSCYSKRMQIEEGFRDLKSSQYGFGFEKSYTRQIQRLENLLLIAMLAAFIAYRIGWCAEKANYHYQFQANSIKKRRVLSLFYLGCRMIKKKMNLPLIPIDELTRELEWAEA